MDKLSLKWASSAFTIFLNELLHNFHDHVFLLYVLELSQLIELATSETVQLQKLFVPELNTTFLLWSGA